MIQRISKIVGRLIADKKEDQLGEDRPISGEFVMRPVIAISRQLGSGGGEIANGIAKRLGCQVVGWTIVNEVAKRSEVRKELMEALSERSQWQVRRWIGEVLHDKLFAEGDYHRYLLETIYSLTELGSVVMLGRGASYVPKTRPRLDVRIVAPLESRVERLTMRREFSRGNAYEAIKSSDADRARFVRKIFGKDWKDASEHDLVINTGHIDTSGAVDLIDTAWSHIRFSHYEDYVTSLGDTGDSE